MRSFTSIAAEVRNGKHIAEWSVVEGSHGHILAGIKVISERIQQLPIGATVGIWALGNDRFSLFERREPRVEPPFNEVASRMQDCEEDDPTRHIEHPGFE